MDVDYLNKYNDRYGHEAGDRVLQAVVNYIKDTIRKTDRMYRYGGEEFLLLMPETPARGANTLAQRLLTGIEGLEIRHEDSPIGRVTASMGIATMVGNGPEEDRDHLISRADIALYQAKENGRNLCIISSDSETGNTASSKTAA
ncbi:MAG: GGDEF domain-containing protein [Gammaproteobacteria bacterium]|nr:GGDEF domain-containing protein [Gammaproteobacteria bacterium]